MKRVLTLLSLVICFSAFAGQDQREFLNSDFKPVQESEGAMYYRHVSQSNDSLYYSEVFYLNDSPQMKGHYLDEDLNVLHGLCSYYYKNGQKESEGYYENGKRRGIWERFDLFGEKKADKYYPEEDQTVSEKFKTQLASFDGGYEAWSSFLKENVEFPKEAELLELPDGEVNVNLKLDSEGYVIGYDLLSTTSRYYSKEAVRIVGLMPKWNPAFRDGKPVASSYIISIPFSSKSGAEDTTAQK